MSSAWSGSGVYIKKIQQAIGTLAGICVIVRKDSWALILWYSYQWATFLLQLKKALLGPKRFAHWKLYHVINAQKSFQRIPGRGNESLFYIYYVYIISVKCLHIYNTVPGIIIHVYWSCCLHIYVLCIYKFKNADLELEAVHVPACLHMWYGSGGHMIACTVSQHKLLLHVVPFNYT